MNMHGKKAQLNITKKGISFGKKKEEKQPAEATAQQMPAMGADVAERLRMMEERYSNLRQKVQVLDQNMLGTTKKTTTTVQAFEQELDQMKHDLEEMKTKMMLIIKELKVTAKTDELETVKRYMEYWQPIEFATKEQVKKMIEDALEESK